MKGASLTGSSRSSESESEVEPGRPADIRAGRRTRDVKKRKWRQSRPGDGLGQPLGPGPQEAAVTVAASLSH